MSEVLFVLAAICFGLAAFGVPKLNWTSAGFCLLTIAIWLV
jgi:hypothetical protein